MVHVAHAAQADFWLTARIQDCKVATEKETASAKCFLKIHWEDDDFPNKIRAEKRKVPSTGDVAEQTKDLDLEKLAVDLEEGYHVYGMVDAAPDSFPINIDSIFLNQLSAERIASLCWTKYDKDAGLVSVSGAGSRTQTLCSIKSNLPLRSVPSDPVHAGTDRGERHGPRSDEPAELPLRQARRPILLGLTRHD